MLQRREGDIVLNYSKEILNDIDLLCLSSIKNCLDKIHANCVAKLTLYASSILLPIIESNLFTKASFPTRGLPKLYLSS